MKESYKLYMVLLGCVPKGRLTEQHDIFFGIGSSLKELIADMYKFWPDASDLHIDAWREVTAVDGYNVTIVPKVEAQTNDDNLFFINLGGYKAGELEEYHYKMVTVGKTMAEAIKKSKKSTFYKHYGMKGAAASHIDDKYGIDVDNLYKVEEILAPHLTEQYSLALTKADDVLHEDELHIGYVRLSKLKKTP
jgi:hypothetical protein